MEQSELWNLEKGVIMLCHLWLQVLPCHHFVFLDELLWESTRGWPTHTP